jgi:hypothetical protein
LVSGKRINISLALSQFFRKKGAEKVWKHCISVVSLLPLFETLLVHDIAHRFYKPL